MGDRMDQLITESVRQGFMVWQHPRGGWMFRKGLITVTCKITPETARQWVQLIGSLRGAGLVFPPERE